MRENWKRHAVVMSACALTMAVLPATAYAATTQVPCATPALINAVTTASPGDTLVLASGCQYILNNTTGQIPAINIPLTIDGKGSTIQRDASASAFRIFSVYNDLDLDRINLAGGAASGAGANDRSGGAIAVFAGTLNVDRSQLSSNTADGFGGAIAVFAGTLIMDRSQITNNSADYSGGVGGLPGTTSTIDRSVIAYNQVTSNGGGAANDGIMKILRSVITNNSAAGRGGGIANDGMLKLDRTTISSNTASGPSGVGGGISNLGGGTVAVDRSTVIGNSATNAPGGIDNASGTVSLSRTTVSGNTPTNCSPTTVPGCPN